VRAAATRTELSAALELARAEGRKVGLVPTMGYLHEGHLRLVDLARRHCEFLVASIFVNPLQFGAGEDLERYPRDLERDKKDLEARGVDLTFHPAVEEMYPGGDPVVTVDPGPLGSVLCGAFRPGHFRGVLTVVARLFGLVRPDIAVFGQKDFQQAALIRRMVADLEFGVQVLVGPTVREADGLALSSRNVYLDPLERRDAVGLYRALSKVEESFRQGEESVDTLRAILEDEVKRYPSLELQYGDLVDPHTLQRPLSASPGVAVVAAARCGNTRLIDNLVLSPGKGLPS